MMTPCRQIRAELGTQRVRWTRDVAPFSLVSMKEPNFAGLITTVSPTLIKKVDFFSFCSQT